MKHKPMSWVVGLWVLGAVLPAAAERDPGASLNHNFAVIYQHGPLAQTAVDTTQTHRIVADFEHRRQGKTYLRHYAHRSPVVMGDDTPLQTPLGDPLK